MTVANMSPAVIARQTFVAEQIAIVTASGHGLSKRWVAAIIRAGEGVLDRAGRAEFTARCVAYNTTVAACECEAGKHGNPCKHRAFVRLVEKWSEQ